MSSAVPLTFLSQMCNRSCLWVPPCCTEEQKSIVCISHPLYVPTVAFSIKASGIIYVTGCELKRLVLRVNYYYCCVSNQPLIASIFPWKMALIDADSNEVDLPLCTLLKLKGIHLMWNSVTVNMSVVDFLSSHAGYWVFVFSSHAECIQKHTQTHTHNVYHCSSQLESTHTLSLSTASTLPLLWILEFFWVSLQNFSSVIRKIRFYYLFHCLSLETTTACLARNKFQAHFSASAVHNFIPV